MASLKIQVLGKGLIPRGLGIAPRKAPFNADLTLIQTILKTPGLKVRMQNPTNPKQFINVTNQTVQRLWEKYSNMPVPAIAPATTVQKTENPAPTAPTIPPAAAAMVHEAVNNAAEQVFGEKDPVAPEAQKVPEKPEEERKPNGMMVKPFNPEERKHDNGKKK